MLESIRSVALGRSHRSFLREGGVCLRILPSFPSQVMFLSKLLVTRLEPQAWSSMQPKPLARLLGDTRRR